MLRPIDSYFLQHDEPVNSCLQFLRQQILSHDRIVEAWKYGMPFYCVQGKMFCYLWVHKKFKQPYIGFVKGREIEHPDLITEKRAKMKILLVDHTQDIPVNKIDGILKIALDNYVNGEG